MDDALDGLDNWLTRESPHAFRDVIGCHWCGGDGEVDDGPCERESCQTAAEDDHRHARIANLQGLASDCDRAVIRCYQLAARYVREGDGLNSERVQGCIRQAGEWMAQANDARRKARGLFDVAMEEAAE